jgi:hypothetical protein
LEHHPSRACPAGHGELLGVLALAAAVGTERFAFESQLLLLTGPFLILFGRLGAQAGQFF